MKTLLLILLMFCFPLPLVYAENNDTSSMASYAEEQPVMKELPQANHLVFNGEPQQLVKEGKAEGGILEYAIGDNAGTAPESEYSTEVPSGTDPNTYYVWVRIKDDSSIAPVCIPAVIEDLKFETEWETGTEYQRNSSTPIAFRFYTNAVPDPADEAHFAGVLSNDVELDETCYEIDWQAQKISMTSSFMDRLEEGDYVIAVLFDVGNQNCYTDGKFTVLGSKSESHETEVNAAEPPKLPGLTAVLIPIAVLAALLKMTI